MTPPAIIKYEGKTYEIRGAVEDHIMRQVRENGVYQRDLLETVRSLGLRGTYLDLGANIGTCAVYFLLFCESDRVVCVEAHPEISEVLRFNLEHQQCEKPCIVINAAVVGGNESVAVGEINTINTGRKKVTDGNGSVYTARLSELLNQYHPRFVKMDLQGWEFLSIYEAYDEIERQRPALAVRFLSEEEGAADFRSTNRMLRGLGYRCFGPWCYSPMHIWAHIDDRYIMEKLSPFAYEHDERKK